MSKKIKCIFLSQLNNKRGVTLVELLVVIAVIGVALIPASQALINGMNTYAIENENMERVYDAQGTLDYITDRVRLSADKNIAIVDVSDVKLENFPKEDVSNKVLVINDRVIYHDGLNTIREFEHTTTRVLLENATALTFDDIETVTKEDVEKLSRFSVAIELEKREYGQESFETTIYLRNK